MKPSRSIGTILAAILAVAWLQASARAGVSVAVTFNPAVLSFSPSDPPIYILGIGLNATGFTDDSNTDNFVAIQSGSNAFSGDYYPARGTGSGTAGSIGTSSAADLSSTMNAQSNWTLTVTDGVTNTTRIYTLTVTTPGIAPDYLRPITLDASPNSQISSTPTFTFTQPSTSIPDAQSDSAFAFMIGNIPNNYASSPPLSPADTSWTPDSELIPDTYTVVIAKEDLSPSPAIINATTPVPSGGAPALAAFDYSIKTQSSAQSGGLVVPGAPTNYSVSIRFNPAVISFSPLDPPVYILGIGVNATGFVDESNTDNFITLRSTANSFSSDFYPARGTGSGTAGSIGLSSCTELSDVINAESDWTLTLTDGATHSVSSYTLTIDTPGIASDYLRPITLDTNPNSTISATPTFNFTQPSTSLPDAQSTSGFAFMIGAIPGNYATSPSLSANDTSWAPDSALIPDTYTVVIAKVNDSPSQSLLSVGTAMPQGGSSPLVDLSYTISTQVEADSGGLLVAPHCGADLDNGTASGTPDGGVDINDLLYFLAKFEAGDTHADLDNGTGTGTPDGGVDVNDLLFFLAHFEAGC